MSWASTDIPRMLREASDEWGGSVTPTRGTNDDAWCRPIYDGVLQQSRPALFCGNSSFGISAMHSVGHLRNWLPQREHSCPVNTKLASFLRITCSGLAYTALKPTH